MNHCYFSLTKKAEQNADADTDEEVTVPFPDLMDMAKCLESGGVCPLFTNHNHTYSCLLVSLDR